MRCRISTSQNQVLPIPLKIEDLAAREVQLHFYSFWIMKNKIYIVWCTFHANPITSERFIANFESASIPVLCNIFVLGSWRFEKFDLRPLLQTVWCSVTVQCKNDLRSNFSNLQLHMGAKMFKICNKSLICYRICIKCAPNDVELFFCII